MKEEKKISVNNFNYFSLIKAPSVRWTCDYLWLKGDMNNSWSAFLCQKDQKVVTAGGPETRQTHLVS